MTMALRAGSPAIDHGGTATTGCPATDQRGVPRPQGPACDIGAFEKRVAGASLNRDGPRLTHPSGGRSAPRARACRGG